MKTVNKITFLLILVTGMSWGCKKDVVTPEEASPLTQKINQFIKDGMEKYYLWYENMPDINVKYEMDSKEYFNKLLYKDDKWSYITDDYAAFLSSLQGVEKTFGYSLAFGQFTGTENYFAVVEFVYPNSPAELEGLKRGDIIVKMNGGDITKDNYSDLFNADNISISTGIYTGEGISSTGADVTMTSVIMNLNPVLIKNVFEQNGHRIGYLFYAQYIADYNDSLDDAIQYFIDQQITDLVIDLRYNPGGQISAAQRICSSVAPADVVNANSTLVTLHWNDKLEKFWEDNNVSSQLFVNFSSNAPEKLGLHNIYVLTGSGTASASELTITGLKPYMNLTTIGDTTFGKYTGSISVTPEMIYSDENYYTNFSNWGLQPIVLSYANSVGVTDFKDGFAPDFLVDEELLSGIPLGDKQEPLLKTAIEDITGTEIIAQKKARINIPDYTIFDRGFSKYDVYKRELIDDLYENIGY